MPHFSALANVALEAVLTRFEDPQNRTPKAEVSVFAALAAWQRGTVARPAPNLANLGRQIYILI